MIRSRYLLSWVLLILGSALVTGCASQGGHHVHESSVEGLEASAKASYSELLAGNDAAKLLAEDAVGALVFPKILKAGLTFGGQYGELSLIHI